jgi:hypothetical protein
MIMEKQLVKPYKQFQNILSNLWHEIKRIFPIGCQVQWYTQRNGRKYLQRGTVKGYWCDYQDDFRIHVYNNQTFKTVGVDISILIKESI